MEHPAANFKILERVVIGVKWKRGAKCSTTHSGKRTEPKMGTLQRNCIRTHRQLKMVAMLKVTVLAAWVLFLQNLSASAQSLTKAEACQRLEAAAVEILIPPKPNHPETAGGGTGFIVSLDGWILTAGHVVTDRVTNKYYPQIEVLLPGDPGGFERPAVVVAGASIVDFALLKVTDLPKDYLFYHRKRTLEALPLGDEKNLVLGSDIAFFGSPMAAGLPEQMCLFGSVAGIIQPEIYYQGAAVGGMSGGPIMSLETGKVVGIVKRRTVDIPALAQVGDQFYEDVGQPTAGHGDGASRKALSGVLQILDTQFNNGIGAGVSISVPKLAFEAAQRQDHR
jgi:hypothetical protein